MAEIKAVVFDWAGTLVDFGSFAPMGAFQEAFAEFGVSVTVAEARGPMGLPKRAHIAAMLGAARIAAEWEAAQGAAPDEDAIDRLYETFVPLNETVAGRYAAPVPGAAACLEWLRGQGIKIGSTTGYTRSIMAHVTPVAEAAGVAPDCLVCSDELIEGRPGPLGMYKCMVELGVYPPAALIKVDDTEAGLAEGRAAGSPTVGVLLSGNTVGLTAAELAGRGPGEIEDLRVQARAALPSADHFIDTVADLPNLISELRG